MNRACDEDKEVIRLLRLTQSRLLVIGALVDNVKNSGMFFAVENDEKFDPADKAFIDALDYIEKQVAENFTRIRRKFSKFETLHDKYAEHYRRMKLNDVIWKDVHLLQEMVRQVAKHSDNYNYDTESG